MGGFAAFLFGLKVQQPGEYRRLMRIRRRIYTNVGPLRAELLRTALLQFVATPRYSAGPPTTSGSRAARPPSWSSRLGAERHRAPPPPSPALPSFARRRPRGATRGERRGEERQRGELGFSPSGRPEEATARSGFFFVATLVSTFWFGCSI